MPLQRRIPKSGFRSKKSLACDEIRLSDLNNLTVDIVDMAALKTAGLITANIKHAKLILSARKLSKALTIRGISVSKGAHKAIVEAGGKVEA